jgi:putative oxidoreductase
MKNLKKILLLVLTTADDRKIIIVRLVVGLIFLSEGLQKYLFPDLLGTGRFLKIGFTSPEFWAYFTGTFEIVCGLLVLAGLVTRIATIPLLTVMAVAFVTTKWPILIEKGIWPMAHEYRTDFAMSLLLIFLLISGGGGWSVDSLISRRSRS